MLLLRGTYFPSSRGRWMWPDWGSQVGDLRRLSGLRQLIYLPQPPAAGGRRGRFPRTCGVLDKTLKSCPGRTCNIFVKTRPTMKGMAIVVPLRSMIARIGPAFAGPIWAICTPVEERDLPRGSRLEQKVLGPSSMNIGWISRIISC